MRKARRWATWLLVNGGVATSVYLGAYQGSLWCERVAVFVIVLNALIATMYAALIRKTIEDMPPEKLERTRAVLSTIPQSVDVLYDFGVVLMCAGAGWTWCALWHTLALAARACGRENAAKALAKTAPVPS